MFYTYLHCNELAGKGRSFNCILSLAIPYDRGTIHEDNETSMTSLEKVEASTLFCLLLYHMIGKQFMKIMKPV